VPFGDEANDDQAIGDQATDADAGKGEHEGSERDACLGSG
jgi:hypothetical protein